MPTPPPVIAGVGDHHARKHPQSAGGRTRGADAVSCRAELHLNHAGEACTGTPAVAEATQLPVALYNLPRATHLSIEPPTLARLAQVDNIVAITTAAAT